MSLAMKCPITGATNHIVHSQGLQVWDWMDLIDEGEQYFCETCNQTCLVVKTSHKVNVDRKVIERTKAAFMDLWTRYGTM
jgi:hypothetical protein